MYKFAVTIGSTVNNKESGMGISVDIINGPDKSQIKDGISFDDIIELVVFDLMFTAIKKNAEAVMSTVHDSLGSGARGKPSYYEGEEATKRAISLGFSKGDDTKEGLPSFEEIVSNLNKESEE